jgi:hypothetical protein
VVSSTLPPTKVSVFAVVVMMIVTGVLGYVIAVSGAF